jgi:hypothetical protein
MAIITPKNIIRKIKSQYLAFQKMKGYTNLEIHHHLIPYYNPVDKTYRGWDITQPCRWIIKLGKNGEISKEYMIYEYYNNIGNIMCLIKY